jgi:DNA-binding transcriptional LysR family regulator
MNNLGDLEIFARVVSAGSMSAAGRELGLSPAVVSKRLRRLEDRLGTRFMQRTTRQISLTEAGQGFYERVVAILPASKRPKRSSRAAPPWRTGVLKVSAPTSFGRMHIAPHINAFMQANPDLGVNLMLRDEFVDIVGDGYDLAIRIAELSDSSLVARKLAPVRRILVAAPDYLKRHGHTAISRILTVTSASHPITTTPGNSKVLGPDGSPASRAAADQFQRSGPRSVIGGVGIALRSTWDIGAELSDGRLVQVLPAYEGSRNVAIHAVYASRRFLPAKVRVFIDYLADLYGPTPYWDGPETDR